MTDSSLVKHRPSSRFVRVVLLLAAVLGRALSAPAAEPFPRDLVEFAPYEGNPVFTAQGTGHWDVRIRERGWILRDGDRWQMWFTGYDGTREGLKKLGYATSRDGLDWTRHPENPVYDAHWVEDAMVVREGETYYMFAEGAGDQAQLLTSDDGVRWQRRGRLDVRTADERPIEPGPYGTPTVWVENGTWHLFYERSDKGVWLATSKDLEKWINVSDEPVLRPGPGDYDRAMIALNQIVKHDGRYYAYYHGTAADTSPALWTSNVAVSEDLVRWTKSAGNPLFPAAQNKSSPQLVHDGVRYRLYTMHDRVDVHFPRER